VILFGPDLGELRERAKQAVMQHLVALAERDVVPPTMRAKYVQKLAEATAFKTSGTIAPLLQGEADLRGVSVEEQADLIISMAAPSDDLEIYRMRTNVAIDNAEDEDAIAAIMQTAGVAFSLDLTLPS